MFITLWGFLMMIIAVALLHYRGVRGIYQAFVITAPLFITVVNYLFVGSTVLRTSYFFGIIFIILYLCKLGIKTNKTVEEKITLRKDVFPALTFILIITVSLFMPFVLEGDIKVISFESSVGLIESVELKKLEFSQSNITQLAYPFFQIILFIIAASYIAAKNNIKETINLLLKGSLFVLFTGLLHIFLIQIGGVGILQGIKFIITGSTGYKASAGMGLFGLARMHSWAGEPGYSSFLFLAIIGLLMGPVLTKDHLFFKKRRKALIVCALFFAGIILSTGTTGYIGIIILFFLAFIASFAISKKEMQIKRRYLVMPVVVLPIIFIGIQFVTGFSFIGYFQEQHLSKLTEFSGSGLVRVSIVTQNIQSFLASPILGIGYGSERSLALSTFLLSNTGVAGFLSFLLIALFLLKKMWDIMKNTYATSEEKTLALGLFISFGTMFTLMQFAKSESSLLFHYFWIIAACMLALSRIFKSRITALKHAFDY